MSVLFQRFLQKVSLARAFKVCRILLKIHQKTHFNIFLKPAPHISINRTVEVGSVCVSVYLLLKWFCKLNNTAKIKVIITFLFRTFSSYIFWFRTFGYVAIEPRNMCDGTSIDIDLG